MKTTIFVAPVLGLLSLAGLQAASDVPAEAPPAETVAGAGKGGGAGFRPADSKSSLRYHAPAQFGSHGTFAAWVNLDEPSSAAGALLSAGTPDTGWILLQIADGKLSFVLQRGVKPFVGENECYLNISAPVGDWAPNSWHHIAAAWDARGPAESLAALFVDGQMVEERNTASLAEGWGPEILFIGSSSASAAAPRIAGTLDDVAVFPFAVPPEQITAVIGGDRTGAALSADFESNADAMDLRSSPDDAAARAEARAKWPR